MASNKRKTLIAFSAFPPAVMLLYAGLAVAMPEEMRNAPEAIWFQYLRTTVNTACVESGFDSADHFGGEVCDKVNEALDKAEKVVEQAYEIRDLVSGELVDRETLITIPAIDLGDGEMTEEVMVEAGEYYDKLNGYKEEFNKNGLVMDTMNAADDIRNTVELVNNDIKALEDVAESHLKEYLAFDGTVMEAIEDPEAVLTKLERKFDQKKEAVVDNLYRYAIENLESNGIKFPDISLPPTDPSVMAATCDNLHNVTTKEWGFQQGDLKKFGANAEARLEVRAGAREVFGGAKVKAIGGVMGVEFGILNGFAQFHARAGASVLAEDSCTKKFVDKTKLKKDWDAPIEANNVAEKAEHSAHKTADEATNKVTQTNIDSQAKVFLEILGTVIYESPDDGSWRGEISISSMKEPSFKSILKATVREGQKYRFMVGPIPCSGEIGGIGEAGIDFALGLKNFKGYGSLIGHASVAGFANVAADVEILTLGVEGQLTIFEDNLTVTGEAGGELDESGRPKMVTGVRAFNTMTALSGEISFFAKMLVPDKDSPFFKMKKWDWTLYKFEGIKLANQVIFDFKREQNRKGYTLTGTPTEEDEYDVDINSQIDKFYTESMNDIKNKESQIRDDTQKLLAAMDVLNKDIGNIVK